jgi:hypothetical protein
MQAVREVQFGDTENMLVTDNIRSIGQFQRSEKDSK